jgi:hypothetical protein
MKEQNENPIGDNDLEGTYLASGMDAKDVKDEIQRDENGYDIDDVEAVETEMNIKISIDNMENQLLLDNSLIGDAWQRILEEGVRRMVTEFLGLHRLKVSTEKIEYETEYHEESEFWFTAIKDEHHAEVYEITKNLCALVPVLRVDFKELEDHKDTYAVKITLKEPYKELYQFIGALNQAIADTPYKLPQGFNVSKDQRIVSFSLRRRPSSNQPT